MDLPVIGCVVLSDREGSPASFVCVFRQTIGLFGIVVGFLSDCVRLLGLSICLRGKTIETSATAVDTVLEMSPIHSVADKT